jgi:hypothetical protein
MSTDSAEGTRPDPAPSTRPQTVDWALWALIVTAVLSIANGFARNFSESWVISNYRKTSADKNKTPAQLHKLFVDSKTTTIVTIILIAGILLVLGKYMRDGKNWARWVLTFLLVVPVLPTAYVFFITYAFTDGPFAIKLFGGLTGLAAVTAVSMMFVRPSVPYFRKVDSARRPSLLDGFLKPRGSFTNPAAVKPSAAATKSSGPDLVKRVQVNPASVKGAGPRRQARSKSRKAPE